MKWLREGISVLAALVAIFAMWLGRSAVKLENGNTEACLHLNQDQVNSEVPADSDYLSLSRYLSFLVFT